MPVCYTKKNTVIVNQSLNLKQGRIVGKCTPVQEMSNIFYYSLPVFLSVISLDRVCLR